jgi:hypothetical protein
MKLQQLWDDGNELVSRQPWQDSRHGWHISSRTEDKQQQQ